jgi:hypothetical protein
VAGLSYSSIRRLAHHVADASADDLPGVQAEAGRRGLVDELIAAVGVAVGDEDRGVVGRQGRLPLASRVLGESLHASASLKKLGGGTVAAKAASSVRGVA